MDRWAWVTCVVLAGASMTGCGDSEGTAGAGGSGGQGAAGGGGSGNDGGTGSTTETETDTETGTDTDTETGTDTETDTSTDTATGTTFVCANIANDPSCTYGDREQCLCEACFGMCDAGGGSVSDCICPVCTLDPYCSDPENCVDDGLCHPFHEGCVCADCANHPSCAFATGTYTGTDTSSSD